MAKRKLRGLGDIVSEALARIGITEDRVSSLIGTNCGCSKRRELLNRFSSWAVKFLQGKTKELPAELEELKK